MGEGRAARLRILGPRVGGGGGAFSLLEPISWLETV